VYRSSGLRSWIIEKEGRWTMWNIKSNQNIKITAT